jgi:hypothetical protein
VEQFNHALDGDGSTLRGSPHEALKDYGAVVAQAERTLTVHPQLGTANTVVSVALGKVQRVGKSQSEIGGSVGK